jgi:RNA polymerase sigma-70 factor (ECF subfamily)
LQEEEEFIKQLLDPKCKMRHFKALVNLSKPLYNHIWNIILNHDDTNDVLQNTFIKIFQNLKKFKGESKLSWMYRIATNEALTFKKKKSEKAEVSSETLQNKVIDNLKSDSYFDGNEIQIKLHKAL